jgi:hypothetical protein
MKKTFLIGAFLLSALSGYTQVVAAEYFLTRIQDRETDFL